MYFGHILQQILNNAKIKRNQRGKRARKTTLNYFHGIVYAVGFKLGLLDNNIFRCIGDAFQVFDDLSVKNTMSFTYTTPKES